MGLAYSQGPGKGVSKDTRACSAGVIDSTYAFMMKYFPVSEAPDDCRNRKCDCGTQARVQLDTYSSKSNLTAVERRRQTGFGFGLHCVYAAGTDDVRAKQSGSYSQADLESIFSDKFGDMSKFDIFMDYSTGLFTSDISSFTKSLEEDSVEYLTYTWTSGSIEYISVLVHPPKTTIIHEVIAESSSAPKYLLDKAQRQEGSRFSFRYLGGKVGAPELEADTMSALYVSRVSTDISRDQTYFETVFGLSSSNFNTYTGVDLNGNSYKVLEVQMSNQATTKYKLVQPADTSSGSFSVSWWENYQTDVNKDYMTSATCGWPLLGDNHNAFDWIHGFDQKTFVEGMKELGMPYFCKTEQNNVKCYFTTPYGYQIQLDGTYSNPPTYYDYSSEGTLCATYLEYCD